MRSHQNLLLTPRARRGLAALRRATCIAALLAVLTAALLPPASVQAQAPDTAPLPNTGPLTAEEVRTGAGTLYKPGSVLVGIIAQDGAATAALDGAASPLASALAELQAEVVDVLDFGPPPEAAAAAAPQSTGAPAADQTLVLKVPEGQEWQTIERLAQTPGVIYAEPNGLAFAAQEDGAADTAEAGEVQSGPERAYAVDDTLYEAEQWYLQRIHASRAWQAVATYRGILPPVRVAVLDTGIDFGHPDLAGRILDGKSYIEEVQFPIDDNGHGTHIAGLLGAGTNDAIGMAGAAPFVQIDPYKVLASDGRGDVVGIAGAIMDAATAGARVINLSLQTTVNNFTLQRAVQEAHARGVLLIAAGGNYTGSVAYPAAYPEVLAVAATDYWDGRSAYSARGAALDIAAPGGNVDPDSGIGIKVLSTWPANPLATCRTSLYQEDGGYYCLQTGTSMSAGIVSGVAALVWAVNPALTAQQVRQILVETATPLPLAATDVGAGRVNAHLAVRRALSPSFRDSQAEWMQAALQGAEPYSITMTLQNPSLQPLSYQATIPRSTSWLRFANGSATANGSVRFGQSAHLALTVDPSGLRDGAYSTTVQVVGTAPNNSRVTWSKGFTLRVGHLGQLYLPQVHLSVTPVTTQAVQPVAFRWETPAVGARQVLTLTADGSQLVALHSFGFPLQQDTHWDIRVHANGGVSMPGSNNTLGANRCLGDSAWPNQGVFGWWADLDPTAPAAQVSTFAVGNDRHVVEYENVPVETGGTATFQIVLYRSGAIRLNYRTLPGGAGALPRATVGVEARDGRFFNQLYCNDGAAGFGTAPRSGESFLINPGDIF